MRLPWADEFIASVLAVNPGLAGRCLHEGGAQVSEEAGRAVSGRLREVMETPSLSVRARVPCGVLLGRLPDPRFHDASLYCLPKEPLLGFVEVPAGPFNMGSDRRTVDQLNRWAQQNKLPANLFDDEKGHRKSEPMPYPYWIARYPVTNAQFRCFVQDAGYTDERWQGCWTAAGLRWLQGDRWSEDLDHAWQGHYEYYRAQGDYSDYEDYADFRERGVLPYLDRLRKDTEGDPYWLNDPFNAPGQPVVGVTWYEAHAYARWLSKRLRDEPRTPRLLRELFARGYAVQLPSEPEWEKGARGGLQIPDDRGKLMRNPQPARQWPWGDEWDAGLCNAAEGDDPVLWLSPVGMYVDGRSPYGCLDMSGNVWEWTRSVYDEYPYPAEPAAIAQREDENSTEVRVVRGGSWGDPREGVRCAFRGGGLPYLRDYFLGFRVVCAPKLF